MHKNAGGAINICKTVEFSSFGQGNWSKELQAPEIMFCKKNGSSFSEEMCYVFFFF